MKKIFIFLLILFSAFIFGKSVDAFCDTGNPNGCYECTGYYNVGSSYKACYQSRLCNAQDREYREYYWYGDCFYDPMYQDTVYSSCSSCPSDELTSCSCEFSQYPSTCANEGTGYQYRTTYTCSGGSCTSNIKSEDCGCYRNTNGNSCGTPTSWSSCSSSGIRTRTVYTCSGGSCNSSTESESCVPPCTPYTCSGRGYECGTHSDGCGGTMNCGGCSGDGWYYDGGSYKACSGERYCDARDEVYRSYYCSSGSCYYSIVSTDTTYSNCSYVSGMCGYSTNNPPSVTSLTVQQGDYCSVRYPHALLSWTFSDPDSGDYQTAYQVQVDDNSNFSSPEIDTGKTSSSSVSLATTQGQLNYNKTYYWRVKVWDNNNGQSGWIAYSSSFSTPAHAYPLPSFIFSPGNPSTNEEITFIDQSKCYTTSSEYNCKDGQNIEYAWDFDYINSTFTVDSTQKGNVTTTYEDSKDYEIRLRVKDNSLSGEYCFSSGHILVGLKSPLPKYQESSPIIWFKEMFAKISLFFTRK